MMRIYEIIPGKLLQSARTHTLSDAECKALIHKYKLTAVVNLWHTADPRFQGSVHWYAHNSLPDGRIYDHIAETVEQLGHRVADEIDRGGCVLVHCWGGRNRSGLVSALALTRLQGITGAEAIHAVRAVRRGALVNQFFVNYLELRQ
jgi:Dual specificity phosphatase, catalytic domain